MNTILNPTLALSLLLLATFPSTTALAQRRCPYSWCKNGDCDHWKENPGANSSATGAGWQEEQQRRQQQLEQQQREARERFRVQEERRQREQQAQLRRTHEAATQLGQNLNNLFADMIKSSQSANIRNLDDDEENELDYLPEPRPQLQNQYRPTTTIPTYQMSETPSTYQPIPATAPARPVFDSPLSGFLSASVETTASKPARASTGSLSDFLTSPSGPARAQPSGKPGTGPLMDLLTSNPIPARPAVPPPVAKPVSNVADLLDDLTSPSSGTLKNSASR